MLPAPDGITHYSPPAATVVASMDCEPSAGTESPSGPVLPAGSVPAGFVPVQLVECFPAVPTVDADGKVTAWTVKELRFTGDFSQVLAALALPSESQEGVACLAPAELLPSLWLVNAEGQGANVVWPLDVCSMAKPELTEALQGLTLSETKTWTVQGPAPAPGPGT